MNDKTSRRHFLKTSIAVPAALAFTGSAGKVSATEKVTNSVSFPRRKLGRNGPNVTTISLGGSFAAHSPAYLDVVWRHGVRYFDTSVIYLRGRSEKNIGAWLKRYPERRKDLFLVNKDPAINGPRDLLNSIDERLRICNTDYLDLFLIHGLGKNKHGDAALKIPASDEFRQVAQQLKESGKVKMVGFSCHDAALPDYLNAAAEGGFIDAVMLQYNPFYEKGDAFDRALDACHEKGIGLIAMKGLRYFSKAPKMNPAFEESGLTTQQIALQAIWSDQRISVVCSEMDNFQRVKENTDAAIQFKGSLQPNQRDALKSIANVAALPICPGCKSCREKAEQMDYPFMDVSRYLCYYEDDGKLEARQYYREKTKHIKQNSVSELIDAKNKCHFNVDYPEIVKRAEHYFA